MSMDQVQAYPLTWPAGRPRSKGRKRSPFKGWAVDRATKVVLAELHRMGVPDWRVIVSTNVPLRRDGLPYSNLRTPDDPGAAVYFRIDNEPHVLACDRWDRVEDNLRAISKHVEALRGLERWGVARLKEAFAGHKALPPGVPDSEALTVPWRRVLGLNGGPLTVAEIREAGRRLAKVHHPDVGGSTETMASVNRAVQQGLAEIGSA